LVGLVLFVSPAVAFLVLTTLVIFLFAAEMRSKALGAENLSRTETLSWKDCLDGGAGSFACGAKQLVKLFVFNIRGSYVEQAKVRAYDIAFSKGISEGMAINAAQDKAAKLAKEAAKVASRKHKRITGPIVSGGWEFFEVLYYSGTYFEALLKGAGALIGTYVGGGLGEQRLNWPHPRIGYLVGSHIGSWLGGEAGLVFHDLSNGAQFLKNSLGEIASETTEDFRTTDSRDSFVVDSSSDSVDEL
jgi:hypothetical protein